MNEKYLTLEQNICADSLVNSYYGIGISNCFFLLETQKRLLKK